MKTYQVLKNGKPLPMSKGNLKEVVDHIRILEDGLDRYKEHSPYTIGLIEKTEPSLHFAGRTIYSNEEDKRAYQERWGLWGL
jgi:hypothetical protein